MLALFSHLPNYCPCCGKDIGKAFKDKLARQDFFAGASCTCECGVHYQYAAPERIVEAAGKAGGDMPRYVEV
jgi:hypothetical protein